MKCTVHSKLLPSTESDEMKKLREIMSESMEWLFPNEILLHPGSVRDGIDIKLEREIRSKSILFLHELASELKW